MSPYLFDRAESYKYFTYNEKYGKGPTSIVSNALFGTSNAYEHMNEDNITLHLLIAKFVKTLSRIQRVEFSYIMEILHDKYQSTDKVQHATTIQTNFSTTDAELRSAYVEGKESIVNNLPRPDVLMFDNHSYISIRQCIAHFLASGKMPHDIKRQQPLTMSQITDSPAALAARECGYNVNKSVKAKDVIILLALQWSAVDP